MTQTKKEQEAAAKKRSEAAKKAAATRKANEEAEAAKKAQESEDSQPTEETPRDRASWKAQPPSNEPEQPRDGRKFGKVGDVERQSHRADVQPDDQTVQAEQRQRELDAAREVHNLRTGGFKY